MIPMWMRYVGIPKYGFTPTHEQPSTKQSTDTDRLAGSVNVGAVDIGGRLVKSSCRTSFLTRCQETDFSRFEPWSNECQTTDSKRFFA